VTVPSSNEKLRCTHYVLYKSGIEKEAERITDIKSRINFLTFLWDLNELMKSVKTARKERRLNINLNMFKQIRQKILCWANKLVESLIEFVNLLTKTAGVANDRPQPRQTNCKTDPLIARNQMYVSS
jgi:hypothetical protein